MARLDTIIDNHDQLMERVLANQETLQANQETLQANQETLQANQETLQAGLQTLQASQETLHSNQEAIVKLLEELTRDAATTRRLWLRLAQRYGWLEDEQNGAQPDTSA